ncbi:MAG: MarR family transcriptional regulator [Flavobacteriaceae bacterium]|nr:MarR family transcriptional regulator [Flavobacteriaceae bacterium]
MNSNIAIDFENSIGPWLGKTVKILDYFVQETLNNYNLDLTKEQMIVLKKLSDKDGLNQNELAFLTLRDKSSLTRLLTKMEAKNYITRRQDTTDKRIKNVFLTKTGKETFIKAKPVIKQLIQRIEQGISATEKQDIIKTLKKIQSNFGSTIEHI